jgi:hypothetical protein
MGCLCLILSNICVIIRGGAVALHTGIIYTLFNLFSYTLVGFILALTSPHTLGGLLALSTWLPLMATFPEVSFMI